MINLKLKCKCFIFYGFMFMAIFVSTLMAAVKSDTFFGKRYVVSTHLQPKGMYQQYMTFSADGKKLSIRITSGAHKGLKDNVKLYTQKIAKGIWFVNWIVIKNNAAKGNTVSYVFNLNNHQVRGFFTLNPSQKGQPRRAVTATGTFFNASSLVKIHHVQNKK